MDKILEAIKTGDKAIISTAIGLLKNRNKLTLSTLLEISPSEEISEFIRNLLDGKTDESVSSNRPTEKLHEDESNMGKRNGYEDITEEEGMKKYLTGNKKTDKASQMFLNAFKQNIGTISYDKASYLSYEIAKHIYEKGEESFPKIVRSKVHNLKENEKLCHRVYDEEIKPIDFVNMSAMDMMNDELKSKDAEALKDSLLSSQMAKATAETEIFQCSRCKERKCTYYQLQTRSCDEPMTTFVTCVACGHRWRF